MPRGIPTTTDEFLEQMTNLGSAFDAGAPLCAGPGAERHADEIARLRHDAWVSFGVVMQCFLEMDRLAKDG